MPSNNTPRFARRSFPRSRRDQRATAKFGTTALDCVICDRSVEGARLMFEGAVALPDRFALFEARSGRVHIAELVWRGGREAGVVLQNRVPG